MAGGGRRIGAGRPKGVPNKATAAQKAAVIESGLTPLDYMLTIMRDEACENAQRLDAAKAAAPYVHAKLSSVEANVNGELGLTINVFADDE